MKITFTQQPVLFYQLSLALLASLLLVACDTVPTETSPNPGTTNRVLGYTGPSCSTTDACTFKVEFWNNMSSSQCANCHDSQSTTPQTPFFIESSNVNAAYTQALTIVNLNRPGYPGSPADSDIVNKIRSGHNCGNTGACDALAENVTTYIENWAQGGADTSGAESNNTIDLTPPAIRLVGTSRNFPAAPGNFATTVWPLLRDNCSECHQESSATPQAPFFAENDNDDTTTEDIAASYAAVVSNQKINLDDPAISRLVVRLDPELHNCWDPNSSGGADCPASAAVMLAAITQFRDGIPLTQVNADWKISRALDLTDGILASGGARDDSSTIALYEMKTGSGNTIYDTSGVEPALNLSLIGNEGIDFNWVGGWGIEFTSGRAQGSAQNTKLRDHIVSSGAYSVEAWVVPANVNQGDANDPARIISYSGGDIDGSPGRNFTLGQADYSYMHMNRTEYGDDIDGRPSFTTDDADEDLQASQQHVVVTFDPFLGRKIYVNGTDVSTTGNADVDPAPIPSGSLADWDDSFAFLLGGELGGSDPWAGKLRLVAIHNRAMTPGQVMTNFEAGVGEKFYLMFSISHLMDDDNCYLNPDPVTPTGDQCFIYMLVSQFDSYSYLFNTPTFINLNTGTSTTTFSGMRIGLNGKEPAVGQAFSNLGKPTPVDINTPANTSQELSSIGTIIALEKGSGADEFFLSFEQFGTNNDGGAHDEYVCADDTCLKTTPVTNTSESHIGMRTFDEINATMSVLTGIDMTLPAYQAVEDTFNLVKQQLPSSDDISTFLSAHEIGVAQLAIDYCSALVDDTTKRAAYFPGFGFTTTHADANAVSDADWQDLVITPLMDNMMGTNLDTQPDAVSLSAELLTLITNPADIRLSDATIPTSNDGIPDGLAKCGGSCDLVGDRTQLVVKATCAALLGSAVSLVQ